MCKKIQLPLVDLIKDGLSFYKEVPILSENNMHHIEGLDIYFLKKIYKNLKTRKELIYTLETWEEVVLNIVNAIKYTDTFTKLKIPFMGKEITSTLENILEESYAYKQMLNLMPNKIPENLKKYQEQYPHFDKNKVNDEILKINAYLSKNQYIFHGGQWWNRNKSELITNRPLSTSFLPHIALNEMHHKGKAFKWDRADLLMLKVTNPKTSVFVYLNHGFLSHEKEVLFAEGAKLKITDEILVTNTYTVYNSDGKRKKIPLYLLKVEIE